MAETTCCLGHESRRVWRAPRRPWRRPRTLVYQGHTTGSASWPRTTMRTPIHDATHGRDHFGSGGGERARELHPRADVELAVGAGEVHLDRLGRHAAPARSPGC